MPPAVPVLTLPGPQAPLCWYPSVPTPTPSPPCFLPLLGPRCPLRLPGTPHQAHSRRPAPAPAVPAVSPTWSGSCSVSVLGLPPGDGSTVQPLDQSAEQLRGIGFPGGGGTEARPLPRGSTRLHLDPLLHGSPPPLPAPSSFLSSRSLGPSPHPHDPLVTPLCGWGSSSASVTLSGVLRLLPTRRYCPSGWPQPAWKGAAEGGSPAP